jgi:hypothetical protein
LVYKISSSWDKSIELYRILRFVLKNKYVKSKDPEKDYKFFDIMRPERILSMMHKIQPKYVTENMGTHGGWSDIILPKMYKILKVNHVMFDLIQGEIYYDLANNISLIPKTDEQEFSYIYNIMSEKYINDKKSKINNPDVIILNNKIQSYQDIKKEYYKEYYKIMTPNNLSSLKNTVYYNDEEYILDSILLENWNHGKEKKDGLEKINGHSIVGITCDKERYVYNGWTRYSVDPSAKAEGKEEITRLRPCELIKYNWDPKKKSSFCLNTKFCNLPRALKGTIQTELCFSFGDGNRIFIYIRKNSIIEPNKGLKESRMQKDYLSYDDYKSSESVSIIAGETIKKTSNKENSKIDICKPPKCKYYAKTGKCGKPNSYIETMAWCKRNKKSNCKELWNQDKTIHKAKACKYLDERMQNIKIPKTDKSSRKKPVKKCTDDKEINPDTGRCRKKCNYNQERNLKTGRCRKIKTDKTAKYLSKTNPKQSSTKKQSTLIYDKIFGKPFIEKKTAKFIVKKKQQNKPNSDEVKKNPLNKTVKKDTIYERSSRRHLFIKDFIKNGKILERQEKFVLSKIAKRKTFLRTAFAEFLTNVRAKNDKFLLEKKYTLEERIQYMNQVKKYIKDLNKNSCLELNKDKDGYNLNDIVYLNNTIGTKSNFGIIYSTTIKNMPEGRPIAAKIMKIGTENAQEIQLYNEITHKINANKFSKHFLFTYMSTECKKISSIVPKIVKNKKYYVCLNELAHGDVKMLCNNKLFIQNEDLVTNVALQCLISIATFHNMGYIHNDCHWGNFLYHLTDDKEGYYYYKIKDKKIYLKNCGYNIMIYDFGKAKKYDVNIFDHRYINYKDFERITYAFKNINYNGWDKDVTGIYPTNAYSLFINDLLKSIDIFDNKSNNNLNIMNTVIDLFMKSPYNKNKIILNSLPHGEKVINAGNPYIIIT